jgi:TolB-like protein
VAIPNLEAKGNLSDDIIDQLSIVLRSRIGESPVIRVLERQRMSDLLREQERSESDLFDPVNAVEYGRMLSARHLILGTAGELFGQLIITVRMVSTEDGDLPPGNWTRGLSDRA